MVSLRKTVLTLVLCSPCLFAGDTEKEARSPTETPTTKTCAWAVNGKIETFEKTAHKSFTIGDRFRLKNGEVYRINKRFLEAGTDRRVYLVEDATGKFFIFKSSKLGFSETEAVLYQEGIHKDAERAKTLAELRLPHAQLLYEGEDHIIREWISGPRGDEWLRKWEEKGANPKDPGLLSLLKFILASSNRGAYVGKLDPEDAIFRDNQIIVVDSGTIKPYPPRVAMDSYVANLSKRWGGKLRKPQKLVVLLEHFQKVFNKKRKFD